MLLFTIMVMDILTGMEFDLFVPSFAQLQQQFHLSAFWIEALLSVNFIGCVLSLFIVGDLADHYGRKSIILAGLCIFVLGSICCLVNDSFTLILLGRFLQGLGIAAPAILSFLIIADRYSLQKQQVLMALLNGSLNIAAGFAPVIGSYIALYFQWHGNFIALLILGLITLIMTFCFVPAKDPHTHHINHAWFRGYGELFRSKTLLLYVSTIVIMNTPYWIFVGISPLLYIKDLHVNLSRFGFYQGILAFAFAIGSLLFGYLIRYASQARWLMIGIGLFVIALALILWVTITNSMSPLAITFAMLIFVIAQIIPGTILYPLSINFIPHAKAKISALTQIARFIVTAIGLEIAGYFYQGSFQNTGIIILLFVVMIIVMQYYAAKISQI